MNYLLRSAPVLICLTVCNAAIAHEDPVAGRGERQVLPSTLVPAHYDLAIVPDADALTFTGKVAIAGASGSSGHQIVLNAKQLVIDKADLDGVPAAAVTLDTKLDRATIDFAAPFKAGNHILHIGYHAPITRGTVGFFAMDYDSPGGRRRTLATNFEPAEARQLLPCWDEPGLKASFSVTVDAPADRLAVSNMPVASQEPLAGGRVRVHFAESPPMSTYLLFLGIGDFERIHREVDGVDVGVIFKRGDAAKAAYALDQGGRLLHFYDDYFGVHFPLPKLDLVAAPGAITGGSMENWGAIFFSQDHVLFDPAASTETERQRAFEVIAHEMSHQWFGDLVTMAWWDNLWLNEGFARWMQTHAADALHPEWETGLQATGRTFESGKRADAKPSSHPVLQPVLSVEQAVQAFDSITYNKGAAVITMLEDYVGPDAFRDGVRRYMKAHAYGNTNDADLWTQVAATSGKPVLDIEHDFTRQTGVPLIRVEPSGAGWRLTEGQFAEDPDSLKDAPKRSWRIPLKVATAGVAPTVIILRDRHALSGAPPLVNAGAMAYARVAYPEDLARALAGNLGTLAPMDQLNLLNDAWALGQSGYAPARNVLTFIASLPAAASAVVWTRGVTLLETIDDAYGPVPARAAYRSAALKILAPVALQLNTVRADESSNVTRLRSRVWSASAEFGDAAALERARQIYASGQGSIDARRTALEIVAAAADNALFETLLARVRATTDPQEKSHVLEAMAGVVDPKLAGRMVDIALGPDTPAGDAANLLEDIADQNPDATWEALRPHLAAGPLPIDKQTRWTDIPLIAGLSARPERITDIRHYGEQDMPADARRPVDEAVAAIRLNQRVAAHALPDITAWVATR